MASTSKDSLTTSSGLEIPRLAMTPAMFMDQTVVLYGPTKTGKTVIIKNIMQVLRPSIKQIIVVAPTEPMNRSYENCVDKALIHQRLYLPNPNNPKKDDGVKGGLRFLELLWQRAEMMAAIYKKANDVNTLSGLFGKLPAAARQESKKFISSVNEKRKAAIANIDKLYAGDLDRSTEKKKDINSKFKTILMLIYKKAIRPHRDALWALPNLSENERHSLFYLEFNPRMLLLLDDCAAELKPYFGKEVFRKLFYQNRHVYITVIIACQDDTDLPTNLRKNAFVQFFTEPTVCNSNFARKSNQYSKDIQLTAAEAISEIFQPSRRHRKMAYLRDNVKRFQYVDLPYPEDFKFGSPAVQELCAAAQNDGRSMDKENPFYSSFAVTRDEPSKLNP